MTDISFYGLDRQHTYLREEILDATDRALRSGIWINGEYTKQFEDWLGARVTKTSEVQGPCTAALFHSGTQALECLATFAKDVLTEDTISITDYTYPATLNAFLNAKWNVELESVNSNGLMNPIDDKKLACHVGLYGANPIANVQPYDIVDGAQHWLTATDIGMGMSISFSPTKNLPSSGNGGAIVSCNSLFIEWAKSYKANGKARHDASGTNSTMSELECSHMMVRTRYIDEWQERRAMISHYYMEQFKDIPVRCLSSGIENHSNHKFVIDLNRRDNLATYLLDKNIETMSHYPYTLSQLPIAKRSGLIKKDQFHILSSSLMLSYRTLSLPIYPELTDAEVEYICESVKGFEWDKSIDYH